MSEHAHKSYEPGGVRTGYVLTAAFGAILLLAGAIGVLYAVYSAWVPRSKLPPQPTFPAPQLESHPAVELNRLLERQRARLHGYRWLNSEHTLVAIPIERAMQLIAQRGDTAFAPIASEGTATGAPSAAAPAAPPLQHPPPPPQTPPTVPSNRAAPAGQVTPPAKPETPKKTPTPLSQHPALGTGAESGVKR